MMPRPATLLAIARRDLRMELAGRRGLGLPLVIAGLLLPLSGAPRFALPRPSAPAEILVSGDVPPGVARMDQVRVVEPRPGVPRFEAGPPLVVHGGVPAAIREELDAQDDAPVPREQRRRPLPLPQRTLLFALISASTLTGAVSASIGGERSARTLVALLAAAVTRAEVVIGKWLAWGGLGVGSALGAALVATALGRVDAGWWMLPMIMVPLCAVALSLWLVRSATDVIGGTTVTLRVVPAVIGTAGLLAWFLGLDQPLLGAAVPLGGALIAAGATWGNDAAPALVATASSALVTAALLASTWNSLDETVGRGSPPSPRGTALRTMGLAAICWWPPLLGPLLWGAAGNPDLLRTLPRDAGVQAAAFGLILATLVAKARETRPRPSVRGLSTRGAAEALLGGLALGPFLAGALTPLPERFGPAQARLAEALVPVFAGPFTVVASAMACEVLFRGWLTRAAGPRWALVAWVVVCTPLDPLGGLLSGWLLGQLARRHGVWGAVLGHLGWGAGAAAVLTLW